MQVKTIILAAALSGVPSLLHAQFDFKVAGRNFQVHSFASQGFAYSNDNNYLTMKTSQGSGAMTDGGANISVALTDRLRVGAQVYVRNVGQLGKWHPQLDWAYADYRFTDWFGVRAGKVKTVLGLFNDTQDSEGLHTWAILPQSMYPLDLRGNAIAHVGGDVYGEIRLHKLGSFSYTGYYGARTFDSYGGYYYFSSDQGIPIDSASGRAAGADLRWNTPLPGLMLGSSWMDQTQDRFGHYTSFNRGALYEGIADPQRTTAYYGDYSHGNWHLNGEYRRNRYRLDFGSPGGPTTFVWNGSDKAWFLSIARRLTKRLEVGTYHSRYNVDKPTTPSNTASDHIYDQTVTARFDITRFWNVKIEGHFIDGYGDPYSAHGFYARSNPTGTKPTTNMLVLRTGFSF